MKILFRVSGGKAPKKQLGFGHIFRAIHLSKTLTQNKIYFLCEDYGGVKKILKKNKIKNISILQKNITVSDDIKETISLVKKNDIDIVIVDKFKISKNYLKKIQKISKVVVITDLGNYDYPGDLIINGFVKFPNSITLNSFNSKCLLGPKYQILNPKFSKKYHFSKKFTVLATFGGFDENNIIEKLLKIIPKFFPTLKIKIILGPSTIKTKKIKEFEKLFPKNVVILQETSNMAKEISSCKFGLCAGGLTSYEFASMGIPMGIISQVPHQLQTAKQWEKNNFAINLGLVDQKITSKIETFLEKIINKNPRFNHNKILDGDGSSRIAKHIKNLSQNL